MIIMKKIFLIILFYTFICNLLVGQTETEPNNTFDQASILLVNGTQNGSISETDGVDWFKITIPQGGIIKLLFLSDGGPETNMFIADSTNRNSSIGFASFGFQDRKRDSIIVPVLKGTYYVHVNRSRGSGFYSITSSLVILQYSEDTEPNNSYENTGILQINGSVTGLIGHYYPGVKDYDPADWYKLKIEQGGILKLLFISDGGPETNMFIADSTNRNSTIGFASFGFKDRKRDSITVPVLKGTYYVYVNRSRGSGSYSITSSLQILQYPEDKEPNNSYENAGILQINGSVTGLIGHYYPGVKDYDPADWYKLKVEKGGILKLLFISDGGPETNMFISDSTNRNSSIGFASFGFQDRKRDSITIPFLEGTYYVYLNRSRGSGSYLLQSFLTLPKWQEDIEPNDDYNHAINFMENDTVTGLINHYNPRLKDYDPADWYKIGVNSRGLLVIKMESDSSIENNMFLIDSLRLNSSIASANFGFKDKVRDSLVAKVDKGTYYIVIYRSRGSGAYHAVSKLILPPKADFMLNRTGNNAAFENTTTGERTTYLWKFDDNTSATTINAYKEYKVPKNYNVCLIATNPAGADTICKTIFIPGVERILPAEGGNTGDVTIQVFGGGLDTNFVGKIMNGTTLISSSYQTIIAGPSSIQIRFDLRTKPIGNYQLLIEKKGGPLYSSPGGFKIIKGIAADPWVNVVGRNRILFNSWTTYTVNYGNKGNVDAVMVPFYIVISRSQATGIDFKGVGIYSIDSTASKILDDNIFVDSDTLFGKPNKVRAYAFIMPFISANSTNSFNIKIKSSEDIIINCWTEKPWFQSPPNENCMCS
jgi:PKD repeat protein